MTNFHRIALIAPFWLVGSAGQAHAQAPGACDEVACLTSGQGCCDRDDDPAPNPPETGPAAAPAPAPAPPAEPAAPAVASASPPLAVEAPTVEEEKADAASQPRAQRTLHGFRLGYMFVNDFDRRLDPDDPESSLAERVDMKSPHLFLLGYEVTRRLIGHSWLNIILVGNVMVGGLEQSKFYPSANALIGFEFDESFQIGVGPNLTPDPDKVAHILFAGGWTPTVGSFHVPVHGFYIPDVDGIWRAGMTLGVNW